MLPFKDRKKRLYLDYASATPVFTAAISAMRQAEKIFGNPGSIHEEGVVAMRVLDDARARVAHELGCKSRQIIFTSGLTEANNLAILGFARKLQTGGTNLAQTHWITSSIEHDSVLECFAEIERWGGRVSFVDPNPGGIIAPRAIQNVLQSDTIFISIGWGNNEIGTIQPLSQIAQILRAHEKAHRGHISFHSDAGQAPLYRSPQVHSLGVDMLALGSGKLYGPRAVGALYVENPESLAPVILGGGQEKGLRAGTEKVAPAVGFGEALALVAHERESETKRLQKMRDDLAQNLVTQIPGLIVNGDLKHALPHMLNISIPNINAEYLVLALDREGFALSTKSACRAGEARSHVVEALGAEEWRAQNTLRISLGRDTSERALQRFIEAVTRLVARAGSFV
jgi:cysteine desulfurase